MANKRFTDIFIKRPVLATVVSLLILLAGLRSMTDLAVRQYPEMKNTVITVTTSYPGADAQLIQGFITTPIEQAVTGAEGIDYVTAQSTQGQSTVTAYIKLNFDPDVAFTDIMSKVQQVQGILPQQSQAPVIQKSTGEQIALMYISFDSDQMTSQQITDYLSRVVQPKLETVSGVANAQILGSGTFAMRIWLNPVKMAALNVSMSDVNNALEANNFQSAAGQTKGQYVQMDITATTGLENVEQFENLIVKQQKDTLVRLRDIAKIELGAESYDSAVTFNGKQAVFIGVNTTPDANPLTVATDIKKIYPDIVKQLPGDMTSSIVYDGTTYIRSSIHEVIKTIVEAALIVIAVIFLFLGSLRTVTIPVVTIPLSLIGVSTLMLALGYSINLLTLLALVLAIGLVVDDAIVVVENIYRHIEEGLTPFHAALQGAREIAFPVIAMTITLAAVYAPIGFMGGLTGSLFKEFAFTLASAVIISGVIALTLSPMMCSKILSRELLQDRFVHYVDTRFAQLKAYYHRRLTSVLDYRSVMLVFLVTVLISCLFLYLYTQNELAPEEDQSALFISATGPENANIDYMTRFSNEFNKLFAGFKQTQDYFVVTGMGAVNNVIAGMILKPWDERDVSQQKLQQPLQDKLDEVAGLQTVVFPLPSLPVGGGGLPIAFVISSTSDYVLVNQVMQQLLQDARKSGLFMFVDTDLKFNKPQLSVVIDRNKAALLGLNMQDIGNALSTAFGGNYVNYFDMGGRSYKVIPQVEQRFRLNPNRIKEIYVPTATGQMIPLSTVVTIQQTVQPNQLTQFNQLNSSTLQGIMLPGVTLGQALSFLQNEAKKILPKGMSYNYAGQSRQYIQEGSALIYTLFFSIIVIFLVLAAQFESFRDPLIVLFTVPLSSCGALIPMNLGLATVNIYTQIGLITLVGLISKHGILMVDFANNLQRTEGLSPREAIEKAAAIRLRPILMTTAAMVLGVVPLILARGAGAVSRFDLGLVIASGMLFGTACTLFVVPTMYTYIAKDHRKEAVVQDL